MVIRFGAVALSGLALFACESPGASPSSTPANPAGLARSLIFATEEFCLPYVVDGRSVASLMQRPGVSKWVSDVHGKMVEHYNLSRPGSPTILFDSVTTVHDTCNIFTHDLNPDDQRSTVALFTDNLRLNGRITSKPHKVKVPSSIDDGSELRGLCIHGKISAVVLITGPQPGDTSAEVDVTSDPVIVKATGCND